MGPWWLTWHLCLYICEKYEMSRPWRTHGRTDSRKVVHYSVWAESAIEIGQIQITNCKCDSHISTEVALNLRNLVDGFEANRWFSVDLSKKKENGRHCSFCWRLVEHVDFHGPLTYWSINQNSAEENRNFGKNNQLGKKQSQDKKGGKNTFWPITEARSHDHLIDGPCLVSCKCVGYSKLCTYRGNY